MKKLKKFMFSPKGTLAVFGAAMVLLLLSSVGGARAALTYYSENHDTQIETQYIGVSLVEKGSDGKDIVVAKTEKSSSDQVDEGNLTLPEIKADEKAKVGKTYAEELSVVNSGQIDQYVRVTVYKSWEKEEEKDGKTQTVKQTDLYPSYIELGYAPGWTVDSSATTQERTVLYYTGGPVGHNASVPVVNSIRINPAVSDIVKTDDNGVITYSYQGCSFKIEVEVDAVQTHNAEDAILSAWGRDVTANSDGSLTLN